MIPSKTDKTKCNHIKLHGCYLLQSVFLTTKLLIVQQLSLTNSITTNVRQANAGISIFVLFSSWMYYDRCAFCQNSEANLIKVEIHTVVLCDIYALIYSLEWWFVMCSIHPFVNQGIRTRSEHIFLLIPRRCLHNNVKRDISSRQYSYGHIFGISPCIG